MLAIISPAKKLDFDLPAPVKDFTRPVFLKEAKELATGLKKFTAQDIAELMKVSEKLAQLNAKRFETFKTPFSLKNAKQALFAFQGDTYIGLEANKFNSNEIQYAQKHLRILSGLYGVLSPLDLIQPYRLEMGTHFKNLSPVRDIKSLYSFWGDKITEELNRELKSHKTKILVNLASKEYFSVLDFNGLKADVITPVFKEKKADGYKVIGLYAKRARGMLSHFIIKNRIESVDKLRKFQTAGYRYHPDSSSQTEMVFLREKQ